MSKIISIQYNGELGFLATIEEVVKNVFKIHKITPDQFLDFENDGVKNRELVYMGYALQEKIRYDLADKEGNATKGISGVTVQMPCPYIAFFIDSDYVTRNLIISNSNLLVNDSSYSFGINPDGTDSIGMTDNNFYIDYVSTIPQMNKDNPGSFISDGYNDKIETRRRYLNPRVWLWSKALNENMEFNTFGIFDLTPFIESIDTNQDENGGNFNISLLNIEGQIQITNGEPTGFWHPKKQRYIKFGQNQKFNYLFKNVVNARFNAKYRAQSGEPEMDLSSTNYRNLYADTSLKSISTDMFFKNIISENDIIFITFRDEEEDNIEKIDDFFISHENLPNQNWEMIGLIDTNSVSTMYENTDQSAFISGRDLMKLLIEDGSYFFANSFSDEDKNSIFDNINVPNRGDGVNASNQVIENGQKAANRLVMSGMIDMLFIPEARNIHFVMNLLISTLSNVEICPSRLFEYYGDRITKFQIPKYEVVKEE